MKSLARKLLENINKVNEEGQRSFNQEYLELVKTDLSKFLDDAKFRYTISYDIVDNMNGAIESGFVFKGKRIENDEYTYSNKYTEIAFGEDFINLLNKLEIHLCDLDNFDYPQIHANTQTKTSENSVKYTIRIYNIVYSGENLTKDDVNIVLKEICKKLNIKVI